MTLKDKTVLVTGASKGIGRACAEVFAKEGANVIVNYASDEASAQEVVKVARSYGVKAVSIQADISKPDQVEAMFAKVKAEFSSIDVLVNNAGIFSENDSPDNIDSIREIFETNLFAQINVTNTAREFMSKGKIIFISSVHGRIGNGRPSAIGYSASKAALDSYMKNLAKAVAPDILVNAIAPGRTLTPMWGEMSEEEKAELAEVHLTNRWIDPAEIADGAVFLAKNDAVCGEILTIDGGMTLKVLG